MIASRLAEVAAPDDAATRAVLSDMEATIGELMTPVTATLPENYTVAEALTLDPPSIGRQVMFLQPVLKRRRRVVEFDLG